jgi:Tc5 transposase DNA-binding domain
MWVK